jgi:FADH2-dependent halogenase
MKEKAAKKREVIIVGGGPAGSASALYLLQLGIKPLILEKERFPRYHIGESLTGEVGGCLRELDLEQSMQAANWPVKHGVHVYNPTGKNSFWVPVKRRDENKAQQAATTWQVRRSVFDQMLLDTAVARGAELLPCRAVATLMEQDRITGIRIRTPQGTTEDLKSEVVIDASGMSTFLANAGAPMGEKGRGNYDKQVAVFSQVVNAIRDPGEAEGNTLIFYRQKNHWAWFIPIDSEVVSVGVVVPGEYYNSQKLSKHDFLQQELRTLNPELTRRIQDWTFVEDVHSASNYSYHIKQFTGKGFLCVGDSHRFIDPIFSFGVNFALKEGKYAAAAIMKYLSADRSTALTTSGHTGRSRSEVERSRNPFAEYQAISEDGQDIIQDLVDVFWDRPLPFVALVHYKHPEGMIDLFAGRIFRDEPRDEKAMLALRRCKYGADYVAQTPSLQESN